MRRSTAGYTLLEVLIAMSILAVSLAILIGSQANSAMMTERANRMALASMLVRSKMIDIEGELKVEGFQETNQDFSGDFGEEGFEEMEWEALVEVLEIPPEAAPAFGAQITSQLFGDGESQGALSGSDAVSQWLPMIMAEIPTFINDMCERARRITLTITWPEGDGEMSLTVEQYVVDLTSATNPMIPTVNMGGDGALNGGLPGGALQAVPIGGGGL